MIMKLRWPKEWRDCCVKRKDNHHYNNY